jgi:hypothetical protein
MGKVIPQPAPKYPQLTTQEECGTGKSFPRNFQKSIKELEQTIKDLALNQQFPKKPPQP